MTNSYMGFELLIEDIWNLCAVSQMSYRAALTEASKLAAALGGHEFRVRRLTEDEFLAHVECIRQHPKYRCPECHGVLLPEDGTCQHFFCESCGLHPA